MLGIVKSELRILTGFVQALLLRPLRHPPDRSVYRILPDSQYKTFFPLIVFGLVLEAPMVHLLISWIWEPSFARHMTQFVLLFFNVYGLLWIIGDYRLLKDAWVEIGESTLEFEVSVRWKGSIPFESVAKVEPYSYETKNPLFTAPGEKIAPAPVDETFIGVLPGERLTLTLIFKEPVPLTTMFGVQRTFRKAHLLASQGHELMAEISRKMNEA